MSDDEECPANCADKVKHGKYYHCPVCDAQWFPDEDEASQKASETASDEEREAR